MSATRILWGQILVVLTIVLLTTWCATQWTAWRLGFQPQLGSPWFELAGWPVYPHPPSSGGGSLTTPMRDPSSRGRNHRGVRWLHLRCRSPSSCRCCARGRATNVETYGSARWATPAEIREARLLGPDGVVLGRYEP
jgi:type IV secretion system protein VirD4